MRMSERIFSRRGTQRVNLRNNAEEGPRKEKRRRGFHRRRKRERRERERDEREREKRAKRRGWSVGGEERQLQAAIGARERSREGRGRRDQCHGGRSAWWLSVDLLPCFT